MRISDWSSDVCSSDLHDLVDTYLPAFRAAITEAKAGSIMCAYNRIDGQPACANDLLLKHYLRGAWGFDGYVVSDCDAVKDISDKIGRASCRERVCQYV